MRNKSEHKVYQVKSSVTEKSITYIHQVHLVVCSLTQICNQTWSRKPAKVQIGHRNKEGRWFKWLNVVWVFQEGQRRPRSTSWASYLPYHSLLSLVLMLTSSIPLGPQCHLWAVVDGEILVMQQLCDVIIPTWTKISEESSQHLERGCFIIIAHHSTITWSCEPTTWDWNMSNDSSVTWRCD